MSAATIASVTSFSKPDLPVLKGSPHHNEMSQNDGTFVSCPTRLSHR
jgi:hypothetical protein